MLSRMSKQFYQFLSIYSLTLHKVIRLLMLQTNAQTTTYISESENVFLKYTVSEKRSINKIWKKFIRNAK